MIKREIFKGTDGQIPEWVKGRVEHGADGRDYEISYEGCVLTTRERNYYDDSDFYAVVWDEAEQKIKTVEYATTRAYCGNNGAQADATPEVKAKADAWLVEYGRGVVRQEGEEASRRPSKGKRVRVVRGRKIPIGTEGTVFWSGTSTYGYRRVDRLGLTLDDGSKVFTATYNCEVVNPEAYLPTEAVIEAAARKWAGSYHAPFAYGRGLAVV